MIQRTRQLLWRLLAVVALLLGVIGLMLPIMPTVPFVLVSAWAASQGWPELDARLQAHPVYGPPIRDWRQNGAVSRRAKWIACLTMLGSAVMVWFLPVPKWLPWGLDGTLLVVASWLCMRPEPKGSDSSTST